MIGTVVFMQAFTCHRSLVVELKKTDFEVGNRAANFGTMPY